MLFKDKEMLRFVKNKNICLLVILLIGIVFRIYDLGNESIWVDEGFSIRLASLNVFQIFEEAILGVNPPLYHIFLHYWINLFGANEFSIRSPSLIFGTFAILMIYKIGSLIFNKNIGLLSSLLLAFSVFNIHYSQEARMYSLLTLLSLLSIYFFIKLLNRISFSVSFWYILSSILMMYTHIFGLFIMIFQNFYFISLFLSKKENQPTLNLRRWILFQVTLVILYMPWIIFLIKGVLRLQSGFWIPVPTVYSVLLTFYEYSGGKLLLILFLILSSFSIISYGKVKGRFNGKDFFKSLERFTFNLTPSNIDKIYLLLVWMLTPIVLPFIISQFSTPIYHTRYTIVASPAFYILIAKGIDNINHKSIKFGVIILIVILSLNSVGTYYTVDNKEQWRDVANFIDVNADFGDLLLFNSGFIQENGFDYYSKRTDLIKKPFPEKTRDVDEENIKELVPKVQGYNRVWVILSHDHDPKGLIKKTLNESYNLSYHKEYVGIDMSLFVKNK